MTFTHLIRLWETKILHPLGLWRLWRAWRAHGSNLFVLLAFAQAQNPKNKALNWEKESLDYETLSLQSLNLASLLHRQQGLQANAKVGICLGNEASLFLSIWACGRLACKIYLLNPEWSSSQMQAVCQNLQLDFWIGNANTQLLLGEKAPKTWLFPAEKIQFSPASQALPKFHGGQISILTGGSTGLPKAASRKPEIGAFLAPFLALLDAFKLHRLQKLYIPLPVTHGFGLASLFMATALRSEIYLSARFQAEEALRLIQTHKIEVVVLVPLMLKRIFELEKPCPSVQHWLCGGDTLHPALAQQILQTWGLVLHNLYGSSEAGFSVMARAQELLQRPNSIGRPIHGVKVQLCDAAQNPVAKGLTGYLCLKNAWSIQAKTLLNTGDLAYQDAEGFLYLQGRADERIVSGGENVYPLVLEQALGAHPALADVAVLGMPDAEFGQRLWAFVALKKEAKMEAETLKIWLKTQVARYEQPKQVFIVSEVPRTALGKLDRAALRRLAAKYLD